jgi:ABC-type microcin C transport system duplicated ATPase subunit YejF
MARNDEQKKRRIDFSTTTIEQKEKYDAAIAESGMKKSAFMRMVLDLYIDGSSAENPVEIHKDKEITKLNRELEQLRGAISLKTRANMHINEELMTIRAKVTGNMDQFDISDLTFQVEKLLKQAGRITNKDLLNQIEDPHKIPNVTQKLNEIELALQRNGKIVLLDGGIIEWIQ